MNTPTSSGTARGQKTVLFDGWRNHQLSSNCTTLQSIVDVIAIGYVASIYEVIELLLSVCYSIKKLLNGQEIFELKTALKNDGDNSNVRKVSGQYVDMLTAALSHSPYWQAEYAIYLLDFIKGDKNLCSCATDNILIPKERCVVEAAGSAYKHLFYFKHPTVPDCTLPGNCGFIVRGSSSGVVDPTSFGKMNCARKVRTMRGLMCTSMIQCLHATCSTMP